MPARKSVEEVARILAAAHRQADPQTTDVFLDRASEEVRLVEVSRSVGDSGEVLPFRFAPQPTQGIHYPSIVILLSPEEWRQVLAGALDLPDGWGTPHSLKKIA